MEQQRLSIVVAVAVAMMVLPLNCLATYYTVGGSQDWTLGDNYTAWASGKTFAVGDNLVFKYTSGQHNVLVVNSAAYSSCATTNPLATHTSGNDTITLSTTGAKYYICGITGHCSAGMKLAITVAAASSGTVPSPSPAKSPSSPTPSTPAPVSPSPSASTPSPTSTTPSGAATPPSSSTSGATPPSGTPGATAPSGTPGATTPSGSTPSGAAPSYPMGALILLAGSLLFAMATP